MNDQPVHHGRLHLRLLTWSELIARAMRFALFGAGFLVIALGIGVLGYRWIAGLGWIDALLNASMILSGMGPVNEMPTDGANNIQPVIARSAGEIAEGDFCRSDEAIHPCGLGRWMDCFAALAMTAMPKRPPTPSACS